jgi:putative redox-active protein with C_GCAxxG_C_C motif
MNTLLLATAGLAALGAALWLVYWVLREGSLSPVASVTLKRLEHAQDQNLAVGLVQPSKSLSTKPLHKADRAVQLLLHGCPCTEVILATYGPALGISRGEALEFCLKYAKEMNLPQTCAAVTGACIALGTRCGAGQAAGQQSCAGITAMLQEFAARFSARDGSVRCRQLQALDTASGQGKPGSAAPQWVPQICPKLVHDAAEILEQMLN